MARTGGNLLWGPEKGNAVFHTLCKGLQYLIRPWIWRKLRRQRLEEEMPAKRAAKPIGLAIVGAGRIGLIRAEIAVKHPNVGWIGLAEIRTDRGNQVAERVRADFCTTDYRELLARPEVTAAVIATDEHLHVDPILAAVERGLPLLIEKPLATELAESERVLRAIQKSGVDAVVGYTQRFRRRWLTAKEKVRTGQLGEVTLVTSRAFMNRLVALDNYQRTNDPTRISPMVISGTHALDIVMWMMESKRPVEIYARSVDKALAPICKGTDATAGTITFEDGSLYHASISWALPIVWPGAVYSLEVGVVGTEGVLTIDDTHRDVVLATNISQGEGYAPDASRRVDFLGSYPPGDIALGELWGPMRDETNSWLSRLALGQATPHATAAEAHNRLMLTKAFDLSARLKRAIPLPITPEDEEHRAL
jgi:predicted dehydrogenase